MPEQQEIGLLVIAFMFVDVCLYQQSAQVAGSPYNSMYLLQQGPSGSQPVLEWYQGVVVETLSFLDDLFHVQGSGRTGLFGSARSHTLVQYSYGSGRIAVVEGHDACNY